MILYLKKGSLFYYLGLFIFILSWISFFKPIGADEIEHLHFSFLTAKGLVPYEDYWQHHLPLIWYFLSFISLFPGFFYKIFAARIVQSIFWIYTIFLIDKYSKNKNSWIITLSLVLAFPYYDYISIRPEFFALPLILYILNIYNLNIKPKFNLWLILSIVLSLFLTPRIYLFIFIFAIYFVFKNDYKTNLKATFSLLLMLSFSFLFIVDLQDIIFFVFHQSISWSCDFTLNNLEYLVLIFNLFGFVISLYKKKYFILFSYLALFITFFAEAAPFRNQSTLFLTIITIYLVSITIKNYSKYYFFVLTFFIFIFFLKTIIYSKRIIPNSNYFKSIQSEFFINKDLHTYKSSYDLLSDKYFQTEGFNREFDKKNNLIHPIFIMNYSYFSFSQPCILENNYKSVIDYNISRNREINYFKSREKLYYINPNTQKLFKKIEAYQKN